MMRMGFRLEDGRRASVGIAGGTAVWRTVALDEGGMLPADDVDAKARGFVARCLERYGYEQADSLPWC